MLLAIVLLGRALEARAKVADPKGGRVTVLRTREGGGEGGVCLGGGGKLGSSGIFFVIVTSLLMALI